MSRHGIRSAGPRAPSPSTCSPQGLIATVARRDRGAGRSPLEGSRHRGFRVRVLRAGTKLAISLDTLATAGYRVEGFLPFPDHHTYGRGDLDRIARESRGLPVITTEKDLVRLPDDVPFSVGALRVEVEYLDGLEEISRMILDRLEGGSRS